MIFIRINESWKKLWGNDWNIWVVSESTEEFPWIVEYRGWCHAAHAAHAAPVPWILQKSKSARYQRSSAVTWRSATLLWDHIWEPAKCKEVIGLAQFLGYDISMDILWYLASFVLPILSHFEFFQTWSSGFQFHKIFSSSTATVNKGWVYQGLPALRRVCGTRGTACWVTTLRRYDSVVILYDPTCKHGVNGATKLHILILWTHKSTYFFNHSSPRLSPNQGHTSSSISISRIWNRSSSRWWRSWVTRCRAVTSSCRRRLSPSSRSLLARQPAAT